MGIPASQREINIITATATEMQNNFGKYAEVVSNGGMVIVTRNGKEIGRFVPHREYVRFMTDQLKGILHKNNDKNIDYELLKERELKQKYEIDD